MFVSLPPVTSRGVKLKISELLEFGKLPWDRILIDSPSPSLKNLISRRILFTNELEARKTRNSFKFKRERLKHHLPKSITNIFGYICRDLYFSDFTATELKLFSLMRSTKLPLSLHSCWLCTHLYRLSSQSHFLLPAPTCPYNEAKKTWKSPVSKPITSSEEQTRREWNGEAENIKFLLKSAAKLS